MPAGFVRSLIGNPLRTDQHGETLLSKRIALPVFCSDPISSVAYATEQIILVLSLGGLALLHFSSWLAACVALLLVIVVASYRQTCHAYPNGGGAYAVSRENLGETPSLIAASSLLIDYVLTVAVSVVSGVAAITSAFPAVTNWAVELSIAFTVVLMVMNLRGVKESGRGFAAPTYGFVLIIMLMIGVGLAKLAFGGGLTASSAGYGVKATAETGGMLTVFLCLRAFASGCTALTGVEAISNGVPSFKEPKSDNAAATLGAMGFLAVTMFVGITVLALKANVHMAEDTSALVGAPAGYIQPTALSQIADATFGHGALFFTVQAFTAAILVLAANTAFNGFPMLSSILSRDGYLPRQLANRGDRLVYSNGVILLAAVASGLIIVFDASVTALIQLYILGVFLSFTLSQVSMVRHWNDVRAAGGDESVGVWRKQMINGLGALATGVVFVIVLITKFAAGAWIVVAAAPVLFAMMKVIARHYRQVEAELAPGPSGVVMPGRVHAVVLVSNMLAPTLRALAYAQATQPSTIRAVKIATEEEDPLPAEWMDRGVPMPLVMVESPYRETVRPIVEYISLLRRENPGDVISVILPEYVVGRWWQNLLHNQNALRLKTRLRFEPAVTVTSVPWLLGRGVGEGASVSMATSSTTALEVETGTEAAAGAGRDAMP